MISERKKKSYSTTHLSSASLFAGVLFASDMIIAAVTLTIHCGHSSQRISGEEDCQTKNSIENLKRVKMSSENVECKA
jgi:hypothetical protein